MAGAGHPDSATTIDPFDPVALAARLAEARERRAVALANRQAITPDAVAAAPTPIPRPNTNWQSEVRTRIGTRNGPAPTVVDGENGPNAAPRSIVVWSGGLLATAAVLAAALLLAPAGFRQQVAELISPGVGPAAAPEAPPAEVGAPTVAARTDVASTDVAAPAPEAQARPVAAAPDPAPTPGAAPRAEAPAPSELPRLAAEPARPAADASPAPDLQALLAPPVDVAVASDPLPPLRRALSWHRSAPALVADDDVALAALPPAVPAPPEAEAALVLAAQPPVDSEPAQPLVAASADRSAVAGSAVAGAVTAVAAAFAVPAITRPFERGDLYATATPPVSAAAPPHAAAVRPSPVRATATANRAAEPPPAIAAPPPDTTQTQAQRGRIERDVESLLKTQLRRLRR